MITYKTDKIKLEVDYNKNFGYFVQIKDVGFLSYEAYKDLCKSFEYVEEMRKAVNK